MVYIKLYMYTSQNPVLPSQAKPGIPWMLSPLFAPLPFKSPLKSSIPHWMLEETQEMEPDEKHQPLALHRCYIQCTCTFSIFVAALIVSLSM